MKTAFALLLVCALAIPSLAQNTATNTAPAPVSNDVVQAVATLPASSAVLTAPLVLTNGCIAQPEQTELVAGGKAVFNFTITNAGDYVIRALVNASGEDANSFYVNVDGLPQDPGMIWDIDVTTGFEERTVNWRGKGEVDSDEFVPKRFTLSTGAHQLIIVGREPVELKSVSIRPALK